MHIPTLSAGSAPLVWCSLIVIVFGKRFIYVAFAANLFVIRHPQLTFQIPQMI